MVDIVFSELHIERLDKKHDINGFDCGIKDLNEFLSNQSYYQMDHKYNVSYVCEYNSKIVAYFTWCNDSIKTKILDDHLKEELELLGIKYAYLPAIKLCRLAVDNNYKGNRIGPTLVELTLKNAGYLSNKIGLRFVTVDAYFKNKWLYDKYDFKIFPKERSKIEKYTRNRRDDHTIAMYYDIRKKT